MQSEPDMLIVARVVLDKGRPKSWDKAWDCHGTTATMEFPGGADAGRAKSAEMQGHDAGVPLSQALGDGTTGQSENPGTVPGTVVGQHYPKMLFALRFRCPNLVEATRWQRAIREAESFLSPRINFHHAAPSPDRRPTPSSRARKGMNADRTIHYSNGAAA